MFGERIAAEDLCRASVVDRIVDDVHIAIDRPRGKDTWRDEDAVSVWRKVLIVFKSVIENILMISERLDRLADIVIAENVVISLSRRPCDSAECLYHVAMGRIVMRLEDVLVEVVVVEDRPRAYKTIRDMANDVSRDLVAVSIDGPSC